MYNEGSVFTTMHATIITGGTPSDREKLIEEKRREYRVAPFDQISLISESTSIGIDDVRAFQKQINLAPQQSPITLGIIVRAELLTREAQHALLKTLEEPPPSARLILEADTLNVFLPTIISRCQIIRLPDHGLFTRENKNEWRRMWSLTQSHTAGNRMKTVDAQITNKEDALNFIACGIETLREDLLEEKNMQHTSKIIRRLLEARQELRANVNPKLVIDTLIV